MKMHKKDLDVIYYAQYDANQSVSALAKLTKLKDSAVRYSLHRAIESGILQRYPLINRFALGLNNYNIFFSLALRTPKEKTDLKQFLVQSRAVLWLAEMGADLPYALDICGRNLFEVRDFLGSLSKKFKQVFAQKFISTQLAYTSYGARYFLDYLPSPRTEILAPLSKVVEIDQIDHAILSALANVSHKSDGELARKLGLPATTYDYRKKRLAACGVFRGYRYEINSQALGFQTYKLILYGAGLSASLTGSVVSFCERERAVTRCFECIGSWDYEVNIEVRSPDEVVSIVERLYEHCGAELQSVKVLPKFKDIKMLSYPLVEKP